LNQTETASSNSPPGIRLRRWQLITGVSLFVGYAGYYLGRSCLAIATPLMIDDKSAYGLSKEQIGLIASVGVLTYAIGKVLNGLIVDYVGGRQMFLFGMVATVACTAAFGVSTAFPVLIVVWGANRFVQSMGWNALVKTASRWYPAHRQATIMGFLSLSFLFGDAIDRGYLGGLVVIGQRSAGTPLAVLATWPSVFLIAAVTLAVLTFILTFVLRSSPSDVGLQEPSANPQNVFGEAGQSADTVPLSKLLLPLLESPTFWSICGINFGLTLVREAFNNWSSTYLKEVGDLSAGNAGIASLVFPLAGGFAAIVAGVLSDRWGGRHGRVVVPSMVLLVVSLCAMAFFNVKGNPIAAMALIGMTSFFLIGPYSYLSGVMALDLGGKRGSATAAGLIDGAGYLGAIASGWGVASIATHYGWQRAFLSLAGVCGLTLIVAVAYLILNERTKAGSVAVKTNETELSPLDDSRRF
jgi:OPA family glycerol-3-phosphate transporter-like MFS transporter